jgi:hypothetical protein
MASCSVSAAQLGRDRARRAAHPEDHGGDQCHGQNRKTAADQLLGLEIHVGRAVGEGEPDPDRQCHGRAHPGPDPFQCLAIIGFHQERDQDADHQGSLESLAQPRSGHC